MMTRRLELNNTNALSYHAPAKLIHSRLGYTSASSAAFKFRVVQNHTKLPQYTIDRIRGTQLTASTVRNHGYVSPWGGVNRLKAGSQ